ncbi:MAG TPA: biopolymer transporter ExbD [Lacipirellulaceae bacterium]|jgi:biopolymer transport protein ExbD|nr:biopolymer transporter ExbD [Lacipirellulaceae bacterium]
MPLKLNHHDELPALNLTSLIDVLFLLVIFFMVATKFDEMDHNIQVAVPNVAQAGSDPAPHLPLVVTVTADGKFDLDGKSVTESELTQRLAAAKTPLTNPTVVIHGDAKCAFQHVASALGACRQAGISELGITVRIAGAGSTDTKR